MRLVYKSIIALLFVAFFIAERPAASSQPTQSGANLCPGSTNSFGLEDNSGIFYDVGGKREMSSLLAAVRLTNRGGVDVGFVFLDDFGSLLVSLNRGVEKRTIDWFGFEYRVKLGQDFPIRPKGGQFRLPPWLSLRACGK